MTSYQVEYIAVSKDRKLNFGESASGYRAEFVNQEELDRILKLFHVISYGEYNMDSISVYSGKELKTELNWIQIENISNQIEIIEKELSTLKELIKGDE